MHPIRLVEESKIKKLRQINMEKKTVGIISLGCDKNRMDSEKLLGFLDGDYQITNDVEETQILIINTCAFLESARKESIDTVFSYLPYKKQGKLEKIIMTGCLPQKFVGDIFQALPEVDGFLGTFDGSLLKRLITDLYAGLRVNYVGKGEELKCQRYLTTPPHYAYLKIADGCNNHCTYCLIPKIRGPFKSEKLEDLIDEAKSLGDVSELILVAQDTTKYGTDLYGKPSLPLLVRKLSELDNVGSIRLLYCYPELVDDDLIEEFKNNKKLIHYIDIPLQHASDGVLKLMGRKGSYENNLALIEKLKKNVPDIAVRSTFIAGFPTETDDDVEILADFLRKAKLFNAGFFAYSKEPDTPAYKLSGQLKKAEKTKRVKYLYKVQQSVMSDILDGYVGKELDVVFDGANQSMTEFFGRAYFSAPDIDGKIILKGDILLEQGKKYKVKILKRRGVDLVGEVLYELTK